MANPKKKTSKARTRTRRAHLALSPVNLGLCSQCKSPKMPHRICNVCGYYNGKEVIKIKSKAEKHEHTE